MTHTGTTYKLAEAKAKLGHLCDQTLRGRPARILRGNELFELVHVKRRTPGSCAGGILQQNLGFDEGDKAVQFTERKSLRAANHWTRTNFYAVRAR